MKMESNTTAAQIDLLFHEADEKGERHSRHTWRTGLSMLILTKGERRFKWSLMYQKAIGYRKSFGDYETDAELIKQVKATFEDHGK